MPRVLATLRVMVDAMDANQPKSLLMGAGSAERVSYVELFLTPAG